MKKFLSGFIHALRGLGGAISEQRNLKVQIAIALIVIAASFYFDITALEWSVVLLTIALVIGLEIINTAVEGLVDLVTRDYHPLAGKVKDVAAGAVLFAAVIAALVGTLIFYKYVVLLVP